PLRPSTVVIVQRPPYNPPCSVGHLTGCAASSNAMSGPKSQDSSPLLLAAPNLPAPTVWLAFESSRRLRARSTARKRRDCRDCLVLREGPVVACQFHPPVRSGNSNASVERARKSVPTPADISTHTPGIGTCHHFHCPSSTRCRSGIALAARRPTRSFYRH